MASGRVGRGSTIALAGLVMLVLTTPASAAKVEILTPKDGKRLKSGAVSAAVKTSGPRFRAFLDGRDVTRDFSGAEVKRASFTAADVDGADADLFVTAGRGAKLATDHHFFRALRSTPGLISVKTRDGKPAHPAPEIRVRSRGRIALSRILLNGDPVDRFFTDDLDGRGFRGRLGADSGLRFGTNAVTIEVELANGKFERRGINVKVDPGDPIAGAGEDRFVGVGETTLLDASASKRSKGKTRGSGAAKGGAALSYEWRLTETPAGSEAKLSDVTSASPSLVPDIPGSYEAQVLVSQGSSTSADETTVHVPVTADPIGAPIQTITKSGAIQIGDPSSPGATTYERRGNWVQMLVLSPLNVTPTAGNNWDKFTGVPTGQGGVLAFNHGQGQKLLDAVQAAKGQIVILSGQGLNGAIGNDAKELTSAIEALGGTVEAGGLTPKGVSDLGSGHWSIIGQVGDAQGSADQSFLTTPAGIPGFLGGERGLPGSLTGYVQKVTGTGYQFISPELISIDTKWSPPSTTPSPTTNVIKVGDAEYQESFEYQGQGIVAGESAIQLLVLDANTLAPKLNETFRIILPDGQTDFGGVALLAEALHNAVTAPAPASNLVIMQDFGSHNGGNWPGGNSTQWLDDNIPNFSRSSNWRGSKYPSKTSDLVKLWNETNQFGSVAGNAGILAGSAGHDLVANYRRPYFEEETGNIVNPVNGGLTMIGLTNAYDRSSVFLQGPTPASADPAAAATSGRIAGVLSRNNQSQLALGGTTPGAAPAPGASAYDAGAFPQLALQPKTPWPCTPEAPAPCPDDPARSGELVAAMAFITASIVPGATSPDIRQEYNNRAFSTTTPLTLLRDLARPANPEPFFGQDVFDKMTTSIRTELGQIAGIQTGFDAYGGLLDASSTDYDITKASGQAIGSLQHLKKNVPALQGFFDVQKIVEYALFGAGQLASLVPGGGAAGGALGFAAYTVEYSRDILDFAGIDTSAKNLVPGEINIVKAEAHELTEIVRRQVDAADNSLAHFEDLIRTDPVKLSQAASNFNGLWSVTTDQIRQLQQGFSIGLQQSFWKAITPQILTQWVIGPGHTDINPGGVQDVPDRGYNCRNLDDNYHLTGFDNPLSNAPASSTSMSSVLWTGSSGPSATEIMVRFLKYNAPPNDLQVEAGEFDTEYGDSYVEKKGVSPPALITDPLFATPGAAADPLYPTELGMSKEEFFGLPGWTVRKLQCGKRQ